MLSRLAVLLTLSVLFVAVVPMRARAATLSAPSNLAAVPVSSSSISLSWSDSNTHEIGFEIWRSPDGSNWGTAAVATTGVDQTSYTNSGLLAGTRYYYRVRAIGNNGSHSTYSAVASAVTFSAVTSTTTTTLPSGGVPPTPTGLTATPVSCGQINLGWNASTGASSYQVYIWQNGTWTPLTRVTTTSASSTGLAGSTTYYYEVAALNSAGQSAPSTWVSAPTPACSATTTTVVKSTTTTTTLASGGVPPPPTGLTAAAVSCGQINLGWNPSTGASSYMVYIWQNSTWSPSKQVATTSTSYTGLAGSTTYYYEVAALNSAGSSAPSSWVSTATSSCGATTTTVSTTTTTTTLGCADKIAPTVPTGLTATATSCSQLHVTWSPSTDNSGVAPRYYVYRNSGLMGSVSTTAFDDTGLAASTAYSYYVMAVDGCGNVSARSVTLTTNTPACPTAGGGQYRWAWRFGSTADDIGRGVAIDSSGNVVLVASFGFSVNFGGGALSGGPAPFAVAKYSPTGTYLWSRVISTTQQVQPASVAVDSSGNVLVTGNFLTSADFGGGVRTSAGSNDIFVAKYSASGAYLWDKEFGGAFADVGKTLAVDAGGNVVVGGTIQSTIDFGGGALAPGCFLVKFSPTGSHVWSRGDVCPLSLAVDGSGNVVAAGEFVGTTTVAGTTLRSAGSYDAYVAKFAATGSPLWVRSGGGAGLDIPAKVAVDSGGNVFVTGSFQGTATFAGTSLTSAGGTDIFLAKYAADGSSVWARGFGGADDDAGSSVAVDGSGNVVLAGAFQDTVAFGGSQPLVSNGYQDIVLAKYSSAGNYLWAHSYGSNVTSEWPNDVAVDRVTGNVAATGLFPYSVNFGGGTMVTAGQNDTFLVSLGP